MGDSFPQTWVGGAGFGMIQALHLLYTLFLLLLHQSFPCGSAGEESACNEGDLGSVPG